MANKENYKNRVKYHIQFYCIFVTVYMVHYPYFINKEQKFASLELC